MWKSGAGAKIGDSSSKKKKRHTVGLLPVESGADNGIKGREHEAAMVRCRRRVVDSLEDRVDKLVELDCIVQPVELPLCRRRIL